jgi:hypothetical protein
VPAVVPVSRLFGRTEDAALVLDELRAHPNGFEIVAVGATNPRLVAGVSYGRSYGTSSTVLRTRLAEKPNAAAAGSSPPATPFPGDPRAARRLPPRVGVRFSDGTSAGDRSAPSLSTDEAGMPTEPLLHPLGWGGGLSRWRFAFWVHPLPPPGPLEVFAEWRHVGLTESKIIVNGDEVREAASRALVLWS